jgi:hypothetical protein
VVRVSFQRQVLGVETAKSDKGTFISDIMSLIDDLPVESHVIGGNGAGVMLTTMTG